jgi:hypothetical protein
VCLACEGGLRWTLFGHLLDLMRIANGQVKNKKAPKPLILLEFRAFFLMPPHRIELWTHGFSVHCSTD